MKNLFILFTLLALPALTLAQSDFRSGYIVSLQGDTLKGQVNYKGDLKNALECNFRANESAEAKIYKPTELKGYGFAGGKFYESKKAKIVNRQLNLANKFDEVPVAGNDSVNFMQVLVKGTAVLFYIKDATSAPHYFLQKNNEPLTELIYLQATMENPKSGTRYPYKSKNYVGILKNAFQDCPTLPPRIDKTEFRPTELQNLVHAYNLCVSPTQSIIANMKPKAKITWGALAGFNTSKLQINVEGGFMSNTHYLHGSNYTASSPTAGIFLDISIPHSNEKLSVNNALYYTSRNYESHYTFTNSELEYSSPDIDYNYHVIYDFTILRLETALRYNLPAMKFAPYAQFGFSNNLMLSGNEEITLTRVHLDKEPDVREITDYLTPVFRKHQLGGIAGLGVKHALSDKLQLFLQANYEFNTGFAKGIGIGTYSHNAAVLLGVGF